MITAVHATHKGLAAINDYIDGKPVWCLGKKRWQPTHVETGVISAAPVVGSWVSLGELMSRIKEAGVEPQAMTTAILALERNDFIKVFRELKDGTAIRIQCGSWEWFVYWAAVERQIPGFDFKKEVQQSLVDKGEAHLPGDPPLVIRLA